MRIIEKYVSALIKLMRYYTEIDFDFQYIDTQGFLNDLETTFSIIARNKETQSRLIREELPNKIYTDELQLSRVIENVVMNAFEHARTHGVVCVSVSSDDYMKFVI